MQSPNDTLIGYGQSITDAQGNVWTITANGQVSVNGAADATTANVTHLAYVNGLVWQENTSDLWWSKSSPSASWSPPNGTSTVPVPVDASPNNTVLGAPLPGTPPAAIVDQSGNQWTIVDGQVVVNGVADPSTADVIEIAYAGGRIWQENSQGLWWYKTTPASGWSGGGIATNPISGAFTVADSPYDQATINVGKVTANEQPTVLNAVTEVVTTGFAANGTAIGISAQGASLMVVNGDSSLTNGATLTLLSTFRTPGPDYAATENNGIMTLSGSTADLGALSGSGSIAASSNSTLVIQSATAGETIQLHASHLLIGGQGGGQETAADGSTIGTGAAGGMSFLASITMDNTSSITLADTPATSMVLKELGGALQEVFLYNGATEVADLKISGPSHLYAEAMTGTVAPYVALLAQPVAHALPMTIQN